VPFFVFALQIVGCQNKDGIIANHTIWSIPSFGDDLKPYFVRRKRRKKQAWLPPPCQLLERACLWVWLLLLLCWLLAWVHHYSMPWFISTTTRPTTGSFFNPGSARGGFSFGVLPWGGFSIGVLPRGGFSIWRLPQGGFSIRRLPRGGFSIRGLLRRRLTPVAALTRG
jgi:hypothetical protein